MMATSNFASVNTGVYYVFGTDQYDEDGQFDDIATEENYQDAIVSARADLMALGWREDDDVDGMYYRAHTFAEKTKYVYCANVEVAITIKAIARSGYNEAATFDFDLEYEVVYVRQGSWLVGRYDDQDMANGEAYCLEDDWCYNKGLSKMQAKNIMRLCRTHANALKQEAERVFAAHCEGQYKVAWHASNGETGFLKVA